MEGRKQAVSIRLNASDVRNLRKLSRRLGVRNSDIIRFAIKSTLARLGPLCDQDAKGRALVPALLEAGGDLMRYLDLDVADLEAVINDGTPMEQRVERSDVQLLAMSTLPPGYARLRVVRVGNAQAPESAGVPADTDASRHDHSLRKYFYDKYVYTASDVAAPPLQSARQP